MVINVCGEGKERDMLLLAKGIVWRWFSTVLGISYEARTDTVPITPPALTAERYVNDVLEEFLVPIE